jgi:hypothetical protein
MDRCVHGKRYLSSDRCIRRLRVVRRTSVAAVMH